MLMIPVTRGGPQLSISLFILTFEIYNLLYEREPSPLSIVSLRLRLPLFFFLLVRACSPTCFLCKCLPLERDAAPDGSNGHLFPVFSAGFLPCCFSESEIPPASCLSAIDPPAAPVDRTGGGKMLSAFFRVPPRPSPPPKPTVAETICFFQCYVRSTPPLEFEGLNVYYS